MNIEFKPGLWEDKLIYANSFRWNDNPKFIQEADHVHNRKVSDEKVGYDNICRMTREKYGYGTKVSTTCAFDSFGAPLIVIAEELIPDGSGFPRYGEYFEVVLYESGINVWRMHMDEDRRVTWHKALGVEFPVSALEPHELSVTIKQDYLIIEACGRKMILRVYDLPEKFHLGIDACEGLNRFYSFAVESAE